MKKKNFMKKKMANSVKILKLKSGEIFSISKPKLEDLKEIEELAQKFDYESGLEILKIFYETSHENWKIARNSKNELIGYQILNSMPNGMNFGFQIVVRYDYNRKGLGKLILEIPDPNMGNATQEALIKNFHGSSVFSHKILYFYGKIFKQKIFPNHFSVPNLEIFQISTSDYGIFAKIYSKIILF